MLLNQNEALLLLIDVQVNLTPLVLDSKSLVQRCVWLMKLAQRIDVPVLISEQYPKGLGRTIPELHSFFDSTQTFQKVHFSCVGEKSFIPRLQEYHKKQLILIGIEAHVCVLQSAIELKHLGFEVFVVVDAVSSRNEHDLKYALKRMKQVGVHLITSEMVFFEWIRKAGTEEFKALSKEFLQ